MDTLVGTKLGGYTLVRLLGSGGMGSVYLAEDKEIGQQVAIKIVRTEDEEYNDIVSKGQAAGRFRSEARAVASLDHLHILPLYRYGEEETAHGTRAYMVMQYRPEGSLWDWLKKRAEALIGNTAPGATPQPSTLANGWPLNVEEAGDYVNQAASALQYAHNQGIVHRDVKPANFLLRFDGQQGTESTKAFLLLSDFGLAKFFSALSSNSTIFGTPLYMAPEQFEGSAGPESDQYALAVMIYYLLAGCPPFTGEPIHLMNQHLNVEPPPIRAFAPTLSAGIEAVLARGLAKRSSERYPSITAFAADFTQRMRDTARPFAPPRPLSLPTQVYGKQPQIDIQTPQQAFPMQDFSQGRAPAIPTVAMIKQNAAAQPASNASATRAAPTTPAQYSPVQNPFPVQSTPAAQASRTTANKQALKQPIERRSALGWIIASISTLVIGVGAVGAGIYVYENQGGGAKSTANSNQPQTTPAAGKDTKATGIVRAILSGHSDAVTALAWHPATPQLASGSLDHSVRLWNTNSQQSIVTYTTEQANIATIAWNTQGTYLAAGGTEPAIQIWDAAGANKQTFADQGANVSGLSWKRAVNAGLFFCSGARGMQEITLGSTNITTLSATPAVHTLAISPKGQYLAVGTLAGQIAIFDLSSRRSLHTHFSHSGSVRALAWSNDSTLLASGGEDRTVQILDIAKKTTIHNFTHDSAINSLAWEPDKSARLAIASANNTLNVWDILSDNHTSHAHHTGEIYSVAWSTHGIATGSQDKTIAIWNI